MKNSVNLLLCLLLLAAFEKEAQCCSCSFQHLQQKICNSDFVYEVFVKSAIENEELYKKIYTVALLERLKTSAASNAMQNHIYEKTELFTGLNSAACGVVLALNKKYIVGGDINEGKLCINLCGLNVPVDNQDKELEIIRIIDCCDCKIRECPRNEDGSLNCTATLPSKNECLWDSTNQDQNNGVCQRDRRSGICEWDFSHLDSSSSSSSSSSESH